MANATTRNSSFIVPLTAFAIILGTMGMDWATGGDYNWSLEGEFVLEYRGTDVLHKNLAPFPPLFYIGSIITILIVNGTSIIVDLRKVYKTIFYGNLLPIGAFLFVMVIDYHMDSYFSNAEKGYWIWLVANTIAMGWLYNFCYNNPLESFQEQLLDDDLDEA